MTPSTSEPILVHCGDCGHDWAMGFAPISIDLFAKLAKASLCPACGSKHVLTGPQPKTTDEGDPVAWLANGDTGTSSMTIWHVLMGKPKPANGVNPPWDPSDFGRCYRLLKVMPSWRARMSEVAVRYPVWGPLVEAWDELTALYEEELPTGRAPKLYAKMKALLKDEA